MHIKVSRHIRGGKVLARVRLALAVTFLFTWAIIVGYARSQSIRNPHIHPQEAAAYHVPVSFG